MEPLQSNNHTSAQTTQSSNFTYVSFETLRNAFPRLQGQAVEQPWELTETEPASSRKKAAVKVERPGRADASRRVA
jgi:hypothetical protein